MSVATTSQSPLELAPASSNRASPPRTASKRKRPQSAQWSSDDSSDKAHSPSSSHGHHLPKGLPRITLSNHDIRHGPPSKHSRISALSDEQPEDEENIDMLSSSSEGAGGSGAGPSQPRSGPQLPPQGLNRGFACMGCRKRKSRYVFSFSLVTYSSLLNASFHSLGAIPSAHRANN